MLPNLKGFEVVIANIFVAKYYAKIVKILFI